MGTEADEQREKGAAQISAKLLEFAAQREMIPAPPIWDNEFPMGDRPMHELRLIGAHGEVSREFSDEALKDYPGIAGRQVVDKALRAMVDELWKMPGGPGAPK